MRSGLTRWVMVAVLTVAGLAPAVATARRLASPSEKTAVVAAIHRAHEIAPGVTARCLTVYISTVDSRWATVAFRYVPSCVSQAANGVAVMHRTGGRWRLITAGSAFPCPLPGHIPARVQRDLHLFCYRP